MKGNQILIQENPKGVFKSVVISGTPKPGTAMLPKLATAVDDNGLPTYEPYGTTAASGYDGISNDGDRAPIAILLDDVNQGKIYSTAYADGDVAKVYFPLPGEELNILLENQSGTADAFGAGDRVMCDDGTGKFIAADADAESEPFELVEAVSAMTADTWAWAMFTGY